MVKKRGNNNTCPVCGNVTHSMEQTLIICHGIILIPLEVKEVEGTRIKKRQEKELGE